MLYMFLIHFEKSVRSRDQNHGFKRSLTFSLTLQNMRIKIFVFRDVNLFNDSGVGLGAGMLRRGGVGLLASWFVGFLDS